MSEKSNCCGAEILEPVGGPFDMGVPVCAECGGAVEDDER